MLKSLTIANFKILMRNRQSFYFNLILPVIIMLVFAAVAGTSTVADGVRYSDFVVPGLIAMTLMQMAIFSVAFVLTQQKDKGILKRLLATPLRSIDFLGSQVLSRLVISIIQMLLLVSVAILVMHFIMRGSFLLMLCTGILGSLVFLTLGFMIAGLSKTSESVPALANIIVFPMLIFGDVFFPVDSLPAWLKPIAHALPIGYLSKALREIMVYGHGFSYIWRDMLGLTVWLIIFFFVARKVFVLNSRT
jgi:ABC-2 type transport system permease protein